MREVGSDGMLGWQPNDWELRLTVRDAISLFTLPRRISEDSIENILQKV